MGRLTLGFGVLLVLIGVVTYFATGRESITAMIPAFIGLPVLLAGFLVTRPATRSIGLYLAIALALLMAFGTLRGVAGLFEGDLSSSVVINVVLTLDVGRLPGRRREGSLRRPQKRFAFIGARTVEDLLASRTPR